jgi:hypothetical protein
MYVLVDTSIWADYFKSGSNSTKLDDLLEDNSVFINDIILAELSLKIQNNITSIFTRWISISAY